MSEVGLQFNVNCERQFEKLLVVLSTLRNLLRNCRRQKYFFCSIWLTGNLNSGLKAMAISVVSGVILMYSMRIKFEINNEKWFAFSGAFQTQHYGNSWHLMKP